MHGKPIQHGSIRHVRHSSETELPRVAPRALAPFPLSRIRYQAIKMSRGPAAAGSPKGSALPKLLSTAGMAAALSYDEEYGLDLSLHERLQVG
jgi:hypothetical protein